MKKRILISVLLLALLFGILFGGIFLLRKNANEKEKIKSEEQIVELEKKTEEKDYKERLGICMDCDNLINGMCKLCGCYVEMRAAVKKNYCPNIERKWDKIS